MPQAKKRIGALRRRVYAVLEQGDGAGGVSLALNRFPIVLIVATLTATLAKEQGVSQAQVENEFVAKYRPSSLIKRLAKKTGTPDECIVASIGTSMANFVALSVLIQRGEEVLIEQPTYPYLLEIAQWLGAKLRPTFALGLPSSSTTSAVKSFSPRISEEPTP